MLAMQRMCDHNIASTHRRRTGGEHHATCYGCPRKRMCHARAFACASDCARPCSGLAIRLKAHVCLWLTRPLANSEAVCYLPLVNSQQTNHVRTIRIPGLIRPAPSLEADPVTMGDEFLSLTTAHQLQRALSTMTNLRAASTYSVSPRWLWQGCSTEWTNIRIPGLARCPQVHSVQVGKAAASERGSTTAAVAFFCRPGARVDGRV
jgi:hypothetical protein